jgi:putative acyl-CoA dehydrogenase
MVALEAMEVLGGNGYVEEAPIARIYREAPVNSIWEGSGNVICLDVIRVLRREPAAPDALMQELHAARGGNRDLDRHAAALAAMLNESGDDGANGRRVAQAIAVALSAAVLVRDAPAFVADAYCATRLRADVAHAGAAFGTLPPGVDAAAIVRRMRDAR